MKVSLIGIGLLALSSTIGFSQTAAATPAPAPRQSATFHQRHEMQQHRIAQGVRSGRLSPAQARRLEFRQRSIGREARFMRAANHGRLTHANRVALNHRFNRNSRAIYRHKHFATKRW
jgi:hypothetical protein